MLEQIDQLIDDVLEGKSDLEINHFETMSNSCHSPLLILGITCNAFSHMDVFMDGFSTDKYPG